MLAFSQIKLFAQKIQVFLFLLIIFGCTSSPCPEDKTSCSIDVKKFLSALSGWAFAQISQIRKLLFYKKSIPPFIEN